MARPSAGADDVVEMGAMRQLTEAEDDDDDWTGLKDAKERRRIQNRLHQRAFRKRRAQATIQRLLTEASTPSRGPAVQETVPASAALPLRGPSSSTCPDRDPDGEPSNPDADLPSTATCHLSQPNRRSTDAVAPGENEASSFPLAPDHKLLVVLAHNMARAILRNKDIISTLPRSFFLPSLCTADTRHVRTFWVPRLDPGQAGPPQDPRGQYPLPGSLSPTALQARVAHYPWIDVMPCPTFRDNIIAAFCGGASSPGRVVDAGELLLDLVGDAFGDLERWIVNAGGGGFTVPDDAQRVTAEDTELVVGGQQPVSRGPGLISWSDPWDTAGWEVTEAFARKWRGLLVGCDAFLGSTNRWRMVRGEEALEI